MSVIFTYLKVEAKWMSRDQLEELEVMTLYYPLVK